MTSLDSSTLDQIFRSARTHHAWEPATLPDEVLHDLYELMKWGPTSTNANPARFVFVRSPEAKARLAPALAEINRKKMEAAPCCVIVAWDTQFYEFLPELVPFRDVRPLYVGKPEYAHETAMRNSSLQGAYLIVAARALGLDVGPMSGFDNAAVDQEFFPDGRWRSNFLCLIGHGRQDKLFPRMPRLAFETACRVL